MTTHEFTIPVGDLDAGGREYAFPIRAAWIRGALEDHEATTSGKDGELAIRASKSGTDVVVHGELHAELSTRCARCLEPVRFEVHAPLSVLYAPGKDVAATAAGPKDEHELTAEEADTLAYEGKTVVLDDLVRDELILQTPSFPLCSEDCPGMSPSTGPRDGGSAEGSDKDVDPRLLPLRRILVPKE
jgi:uncharacterized protein